MEPPKRTFLNYSLRNIPIPADNEYRKRLIEKVESFVRRLRWKAFFFLRGDSRTETDFNHKESYGFNSAKSPPYVEELKPFEDDLIELIENLKFRHVHDAFQERLKDDVRNIRSSTQVFVKADKTRNLYEMTTTQYNKLLRDNVTKHYRSAPSSSYDEINNEAQRIATQFGLGDRMDTLAESEAFITLKDHKVNFERTLPCRLINPAKSELGIVSKKILTDIVEELKAKTCVNLWKSTGEVIEWFKGISEKKKHTFFSFDIVDFYPSISEQLLRAAVSFARTKVRIEDKHIEVIFHARKSLLFEGGKTWVKRDKSSLFDVSMGCYDGAEVCEMVGIFMLNKLSELLSRDKLGLYRDDGLGMLKDNSGREADTTRKLIIRTFQEHGLRITIETNLRTANFLDVTFDLATDTYYPYRKPNDQPVFIHRLSNHPPKILENLPAAIGKRLSDISHDRQVFNEAVPLYEEALSASDFQSKLQFTDSKRKAKKRQHQRSVIWFNPPYSRSVATNIGRKFLYLINKHFPKKSRLNKIFNRNTIKLSYSCMPSMANVIASHNRKLLRPKTVDPRCNCRVKEECPMRGCCQVKSIVYKATVTSNDEVKEYIGLTEPPFKHRYANHKTSFRHERYENSTELSKYVWDAKRSNEDFTIAWSIADRAQAYSNKTKRCNLCLTEKLRIMSTDKDVRLNKRPELISTCRHANKFRLSNFVKTTHADQSTKHA